MNKEALRKELEDCWCKAWNHGYFVGTGRVLNDEDKDSYITTRLAALDDGLNYAELKEKSKKFLTIESVKQWIAEHPEEFNRVDDGQEGKDGYVITGGHFVPSQDTIKKMQEACIKFLSDTGVIQIQ